MRPRATQPIGSPSYLPLTSGTSADDEEAAIARAREGEEISKLLQDERRLSQLLYGPGDRSMGLIGKSNPRYRWDKYWKPEEELKTMSKPM